MDRSGTARNFFHSSRSAVRYTEDASIALCDIDVLVSKNSEFGLSVSWDQYGCVSTSNKMVFSPNYRMLHADSNETNSDSAFDISDPEEESNEDYDFVNLPTKRDGLRQSVPFSLVIVILSITNMLTFGLWVKLPPYPFRPQKTANSHPLIEILGPADVPVKHIKTFYNSGIHGDPNHENPFLGPANAQTNAAWNTLLDGDLPSRIIDVVIF